MNSKQKSLLSIFQKSSDDNGIVDQKSQESQARNSGPSYRSMVERIRREKLAKQVADDLIKPYQDTYRNQIPAVLLAIADKEALTKVILKKMRLAENEQKLARYLLESQTKGDSWLMAKWNEMKMSLDFEDVVYFEEWLATFSSK